MANPEEAYQIARWIADLMAGKIQVSPDEARDLGGVPEVEVGTEGASLEVVGVTGTWEVLVREAR
jgi:hypothetical protein